jgi:hypothetical protein
MTTYSAAGIKQLPPPPADGGPLAAPAGGVLATQSASPDGTLSFNAWVPLAAGDKTLPLIWALGNNWALPVKGAAQVTFGWRLDLVQRQVSLPARQ